MIGEMYKFVMLNHLRNDDVFRKRYWKLTRRWHGGLGLLHGLKRVVGDDFV